MVLVLETADVLHDLLCQIALVTAILHVRAVKTLHVPLIENRRPRPDLFEIGPDLLEHRLLYHARRSRRRVAVVLEDVPAAKDEIVQGRERNHVANLRRAALGTFAEADRSHLRERP